MKRILYLILATLGVCAAAGCSMSATNYLKLKEEIRQDILAELRKDRSEPGRTQLAIEQDREQLKQELEREILAKLQEQQRLAAAQSPQIVPQQPSPKGSADGRILRGGKGVKGCRVKLVRMLKGTGLGGLFNSIREGVEFETVTNEEGAYRFEGIPVGQNKLKWELPGDPGWIRRLNTKSDATIVAGKTASLKPVETRGVLVLN